MAFKYVVTHIADKTYKSIVLSVGQMVQGITLYDDGSSPSFAPTFSYLYLYETYLF